MIRLFVIFISLVYLVHAKEDINKKITYASTQLHTFSENYLNLNKKMAITDKKNYKAENRT